MTERSLPVSLLGALCACLVPGCGDDEEPARREQPRTFELTAPSGTVEARLCDGRRVRVTKPLRARLGCTVVDTRRGAVTVTGAGGKARFNAGRFRIVERRGGLTEAVLTGGDFSRCEGRPRLQVRLLLGETSGGRFRTRGRFASAAVRGTKWGTRDFCNGTLTIVREGRVEARDLIRDRTVPLRAPARYFARAPVE